MAPKKSSSSKKGSTPHASTHHGARGGSFEAARSRLPPNINWEKLSPEKQKNCERAFTAASRRSDRDIDARYQSALTASDMHFLRTGKYLRVSRDMVINEEMYEEEDSHPRLWTSNLRQGSDPRMAALNQQYDNIDLQFQAAFPGFGSQSAMSNMPFLPTAPQYDATQYAQSGYTMQSCSPISYAASEASPPSMTDSAGASPVAGVPSPSPPHMAYSVPSNDLPDMMVMSDNMTYADPKFDTSYGFDNTAMFDGMTDATAMWGAGMQDEFPEFVNY